MLRHFLAAVLCLLSSVLAQADDLNTDMMRATIKLSHDSSTATGFILVRPSPQDAQQKQFLLVTAAHVLETTAGDSTSLIYREPAGEGVFKKLPVPLAIRKDGQPLWTKHASEDVAVIALVPPSAADLSQLSVDLLASDSLLKQEKIHPGQLVAGLGYPHRVEANDYGFPILRSGAIASYPLVPSDKNRTFLLSANTFEGDSGGPVFWAGDAVAGQGAAGPRLILGLISAQHFLDEEMKMVYGSAKLRHRLGLGIVVQAPFIRETIDRVP